MSDKTRDEVLTMAEHTCNYHCDRPECIKAQRDELFKQLQSIRDAELPVEPKSWIDETDPECPVTVVGVHSYNELSAYAKRVTVERDTYRRVTNAEDKAIVDDVIRLEQRAEKAEHALSEALAKLNGGKHEG